MGTRNTIQKTQMQDDFVLVIITIFDIERQERKPLSFCTRTRLDGNIFTAMGSGSTYKKSNRSRRRSENGDHMLKKKSQSTMAGSSTNPEDDHNTSNGDGNVFGSMTVDQKLNLIAELSELVLEDPTKAFHQERITTTTALSSSTDDGTEQSNYKKKLNFKKSSSKHDKELEKSSSTTTTTTRLPSKIQQLLDLGRTHKNGGDEYVSSLAIMSLLAIFKDIIPTYRIRVPTTAERETTIVSQETKQLWDYERALVSKLFVVRYWVILSYRRNYTP